MGLEILHIGKTAIAVNTPAMICHSGWQTKIMQSFYLVNSRKKLQQLEELIMDSSYCVCDKL